MNPEQARLLSELANTALSDKPVVTLTYTSSLNDFAREVHENAIAHGWWEDERSYPELIALCNSELSEALEEYRDGKPQLYYIPTGACNSRSCAPDTYFTSCTHDACPLKNKPLGIAVELADCVIRVLDLCAHLELDIDQALAPRPISLSIPSTQERALSTSTGKPLPDVIAYCQQDLCNSIDAFPGLRVYALATCILRIKEYCERMDVDLDAILIQKHEYNKTRPYRHGGKVC